MNLFLLEQMSSISCHKWEVFRPLLPSLLNFSDIFICEMQYCWLLCCHFTPDAKHAWSTSSACQHCGNESMGQVMSCWMNDSWRVLLRHITIYSFSFWASDSGCQQTRTCVMWQSSRSINTQAPIIETWLDMDFLKTPTFWFFPWRE